MTDPFYKSTRWKKLRERVLKRDSYRCQLAKRYGRIVQAEVVHHIYPRDLFPEYQYESWNLVSLSRESHNRMHDRDTQRLTAQGIDLLKRTARRRGMPIPAEYE